MTRLSRATVLAGFAVLLAAPALGAGLVTFTGRAEFVVDGDTVQVDIDGDGKSGVHVRNAGIQAMERGQCGAAAATTALGAVVGRGQVVLKATNASSTSPDNDGRIRPLRYIETPSGADAQVELLRKGLVLAYPFGGEIARQDQYHLEAQKASVQGVGLWSRAMCSYGPAQHARIRMWVNWDADGDDTTNLNGEYVRILNEGTDTLDLTGWWMRSPTPTLFRFPSGTSVAPGRYLSVRSGYGTNTATNLYWGDGAARFYNPTPGGVHAFGAFLFDPDGDLRSWSMYPCTWGCQEPLTTAWNVAWDATYDPPGDESVDPNLETLNLTNRSSQRIDASYRVVTLSGYVHEFGPGSYIDPGETLRVHMGRGTPTRLHKYMGRTHSVLSNAGGSAVIRNVEGVQIGCARWGDGGAAAYQCVPTGIRPIDEVQLASSNQGTALRLRVIPGGVERSYRLERLVGEAWTGAGDGTLPSTGSLTLPAETGRYRLVIPAQLGYGGAQSAPIDLAPVPDAPVAPVVPLSASIGTVPSRVGVLRVGVQPSRTTGQDWQFQLQRQSGGAWRSLGTYATSGPGETRDFHYLVSGTYRAVAPAQGGMAEAVTRAFPYSAPRMTVALSVASRSKLVVDAGPSLPGTVNYRVTVQKRSGGGWRTVRSVRTSGKAEKVTVDVPRGTYRVLLQNQHGYLAVTSPSRFVAR
jgi:endonuclease YncB( thermonuclease family)